MYHPFVSQIVNGLQRGWKEQISLREWNTDDPKQEAEMLRQASAHSVALQHLMDRRDYSVESIENGLSLPTHRFRAMSLVDRQTLYASDNENLDAAVAAALENE